MLKSEKYLYQIRSLKESILSEETAVIPYDDSYLDEQSKLKIKECILSDTFLDMIFKELVKSFDNTDHLDDPDEEKRQMAEKALNYFVTTFTRDGQLKLGEVYIKFAFDIPMLRCYVNHDAANDYVLKVCKSDEMQQLFRDYMKANMNKGNVEKVQRYIHICADCEYYFTKDAELKLEAVAYPDEPRRLC